MEGWLKLKRSMLKWEWYGDPNVVLVFLDLLLNATYEPGKYRGYTLKPGDVIWGRIAAADRIGISQQQARTALEKLQLTNEITIKTTNKFSIISISNWLEHQADNQQNNHPITNEQPTDNHQVTTSKEGKKVRKKEDISQFEEFWAEVAKKASKGRAEKSYAEALKITTHDVLVNGMIAYKKKMNGSGFIKNPATWLDDKCWDDEYDDQAAGPPLTDEEKTARSKWVKAYQEWNAAPGDTRGPEPKMADYLKQTDDNKPRG